MLEINNIAIDGILAGIIENGVCQEVKDAARVVLEKVLANPKMGVGISKTDSDALCYTNERGQVVITTLGRLMTRKFGFDPQRDSLTIQNLGDALRAAIRKSYVTLKVITGKDIVDAYCEEWGAHSCMTGECHRERVAMYGKNPNIHMLLFSDRGVKGRALLWDADDGSRVLDRIYPNKGWHIEVMQTWAKDNKVHIRVGNSLPEGDNISIGSGIIRKVTVKNDGEWPYLDTFCFVEEKENNSYLLCNSLKAIKTTHRATVTSGELYAFWQCASCGRNQGGRGNSVTTENGPRMICASCYEYHSRECDECARRYIFDGIRLMCWECLSNKASAKTA